MEQNREPRNKLIHLQPINLQQRRQEYTMEKRQSLQQVMLESWTVTCKSMKLEHSFKSYTKINSKWIKDLNIRLETIKFPQENIGRTLFYINHNNTFLDLSPKAEKNKNKNEQMGTN